MSQNKKVQQQKCIFINCLLIGAILLIVVANLLEVNTGISYSLAMQKNDPKLRELRIENERLTREITELGSMANLYALSRDLNMVKVTKVDYLIPVDETLAER